MIGVYLLSTSLSFAPEWGFFGHRKINRMAVFTLPPDLIGFYKKNLQYITEHAVDPDKRRYATKHEAVRHYIDIDSWGERPFQNVPRIFDDALIKYSHWYLLKEGIDGTDSTKIDIDYGRDTVKMTIDGIDHLLATDTIRQFFQDYVRPQYYEEEWIVRSTALDSLLTDVSKGRTLHLDDHFSQEGILPYHLYSMYYWLVKAFEDKDYDKILRTSAEFGHYIGDAHVPLHTTKNYNGQLTDQIGIHAFWESRLPELFADSEYSFLVGKAKKIDKPLTYFWDIIWDSHRLLEDVLRIEKELTVSFPEDQQLCYDERLQRTIKTQCPEFARAYHTELSGMVEDRMQDAILSIGSVWFSAWVDAGQPELDRQEISPTEEIIIRNENVKTRDHSF